MGTLFLFVGIWYICSVPHRFYQKSRLDAGLEVKAKMLEVRKARARRDTIVRYEYVVGNQRHEGRRASVFTESSGLYHRLISALESGQEVVCFVDPEDATFSALEKDVNWIDFGTLVVCLPLTIVGFLYVVRYRNSLKKPSAKKRSKRLR